MKLLGHSISINVLILIGIMYLIMVVNAVSSSCKREGMSGFKKAIRQEKRDDAEVASQLDAMINQIEQVMLQHAMNIKNSQEPPDKKLEKVNTMRDRLNDMKRYFDSIPNVDNTNAGKVRRLRELMHQVRRLLQEARSDIRMTSSLESSNPSEQLQPTFSPP